MIRAFGIIVGLRYLGTLVSVVTGVPIPGNVLGMLLLAVVLALGWVKIDWVEPAADLLVDNLAFLFVPAGVGVMSYFDLLSREWLPIGVSMTVSLLLVLIVTGKSCEVAARIWPRRTGGDRG